mgnify:FL=1
MTSEEVKEALYKEISELRQEFPLLKDRYAGISEYYIMELAQGVCLRLGLGDFEPYREYIAKCLDEAVERVKELGIEN